MQRARAVGVAQINRRPELEQARHAARLTGRGRGHESAAPSSSQRVHSGQTARLQCETALHRLGCTLAHRLQRRQPVRSHAAVEQRRDGQPLAVLGRK